MPADVLVPFKTTGNTLSVFAVGDGNMNAARIVAAIASKQDKIVDTDCLIFDSAVVDALGIAREKIPGQTPDAEANALHWDLARLSGSQLVALAESLIEAAAVEFLTEGELIDALRGAAASHSLTLEHVNKKVRQQANLQ